MLTIHRNNHIYLFKNTTGAFTNITPYTTANTLAYKIVPYTLLLYTLLSYTLVYIIEPYPIPLSASSWSY